MQYFFELGSNPAFSLAEIKSYFANLGFQPKPENICGCSSDKKIFVIKHKHHLNLNQIIERLGGVVKIGIIENQIELNNLSKTKLEEEILAKSLFLIEPAAKKVKTKFKFGFSCYGARLPEKKIGLKIKKILQSQNISSRLVTSRASQLSSVVVATNKLIDNGLELAIIKVKDKIFIGRTLVVQSFKDLSARDYGRPARDDYSGMLPPKLARIMINLAQVSFADKLLDPFCGSGTILTEAAWLGYKNLVAADISTKAIKDTSENLEWIIKKYNLSQPQINLFKLNVKNLSQKIKPQTIDAIITEPYLGKQRGRVDVGKQIKELNLLYKKALEEFRKVLKKEGRIVMVWPVFRFNKLNYLNPPINGFKIVNPLSPAWLKKCPDLPNLTFRQTIIYGRPKQRIWREIVVLKKDL